jgi:hypothetical protein
MQYFFDHQGATAEPTAPGPMVPELRTMMSLLGAP